MLNDDFRAWNDSLAEILQEDNPQEAVSMLGLALQDLSRGKNSTTTIFPAHAAPFLIASHLQEELDPVVQIDLYLSGAYLIDPFYQLGKNEDFEGLSTLREVMFPGFRQSEYWRVWYGHTGIKDEVCYMVQLPGYGFASLSITRQEGEPKFSKSDLLKASAAAPVVNAVISQWLEQQGRDIPVLQVHLDRSLANFGTSYLTDREREVLHLILRGCTSKVIAQRLEIGVETVKQHRKNIFLKLDVGSQSELFYLVLEALKNSTLGHQQDPLIEYMEKPV